jgi:hypothetical protein
MRTRNRVRGVLHLLLMMNGDVAFVFRPGNVGAGSTPLLSTNCEAAQQDLVRTWGFTSKKAKVAIDDLKLDGFAEREIDADAGMVANLFPS